MAREKSLPSTYQVRSGPDGKPLLGLGRGIGMHFVESYFPLAQHDIRIASCFFSLKGYKIAFPHFEASNPNLHFLVGVGEGENAQEAVLYEFDKYLRRELAEGEMLLFEAVKNLLALIEAKKFFICEAREKRVTPKSKTIRFHAKFYVSDDKCAWHGSVNFSYNGLHQSGSIEHAAVTHDPENIKFFTDCFTEISDGSEDLLGPLKKILENWLTMLTPWQAYLKILHHLYPVEDFKLGRGGKTPTYFQEAVIARAVAQVKEYEGVLLLVATGLGKTIIGSEVARHLTKGRLTKKVVLLAPRCVHKHWYKQIDSRKLPADSFFDTGLLFRPDGRLSESKIGGLLERLDKCDEDDVIVIDEAHCYRNLLKKDEEIEQENKKNVAAGINVIAFNRVRERLRAVVAKKSRIVLLTATPFGTDTQNIKSLLGVLPFTEQQEPPLPAQPPLPLETPPRGLRPWTVAAASDAAGLPVVTVLGVSHVLQMAHARGDVEADGRLFIEMPPNQKNKERSKKYLPVERVLRRVPYALYLEDMTREVFASDAFDAEVVPVTVHNEQKNKLEARATNTARNTALRALLSSPDEFLHFVEACRNTETKQKVKVATDQETFEEFVVIEGDALAEEESSIKPNAFTARHKISYKLSQEKRQQLLDPLIAELKELLPQNEDKLSRLKELIRRHKGDKIIVFVQRLSTACRLEKELRQSFTDLKIGCTVEEKDNKFKLLSLRDREKIIHRFSPLSNEKTFAEEEVLDLLICTDADGIGLNMEDACVVVNYDFPTGADALLQRAGRILRMTNSRDRIVSFYTFTPQLENQFSRLAQAVDVLIRQMGERHSKSGKVISGGSVLPVGESEVISMGYANDVMGENRVSIGFLEEEIQEKLDPALRHLVLISKHRDKAAGFEDNYYSAKTFSGETPQLVLLIQFREEARLELYDIVSGALVRKKPEAILELIECKDDNSDKADKKAKMDFQLIEEVTNTALTVWTDREKVSVDDRSLICAVYLKPLPKDGNDSFQTARDKPKRDTDDEQHKWKTKAR